MPTPLPCFDDALATLRAGGVIGLPTETVYGLAADATRPEAVARIFALKGRPADHPLIVHLGSATHLPHWAREIPEAAQRLAAAFWPGPLTLILKKAAGVPTAVTGGQDSVGLRVPGHPVALALLQAFDGGLAAPSANRFGRISPTTSQHVRDEFGDAVPVVLEGGACEVGLESTIVDLSGGTPRILRPGRISRAQLEAVIGPVAEGGDAKSPRASGTLASHYAPRARVELLDRNKLLSRHADLRHHGLRVGALLCGSPAVGIDGPFLPADAAGYGHDLYAVLRQLDSEDNEVILVEETPQDATWTAVRDRLQRAAAPREDER